jgi:V/A-type H+-transporting ATPase subunit D
MADHERVPTRAALLELQADREMIREGYDFLDEKRLLLVAEVLRQLAAYESRHRRFQETQDRARAALEAALVRHGVDELSVYPRTLATDAALTTSTGSFLGTRLVEATLALPAPHHPAPINPSPEASACARHFAELITQAAPLAALAGNLRRLMADLERTARRARALEDIILPEVEGALADIESRLEEMELEDALRVRVGRTGTGPIPGE